MGGSMSHANPETPAGGSLASEVDQVAITLIYEPESKLSAEWGAEFSERSYELATDHDLEDLYRALLAAAEEASDSRLAADLGNLRPTGEWYSWDLVYGMVGFKDPTVSSKDATNAHLFQQRANAGERIAIMAWSLLHQAVTTRLYLLSWDAGSDLGEEPDGTADWAEWHDRRLQAANDLAEMVDGNSGLLRQAGTMDYQALFGSEQYGPREAAWHEQAVDLLAAAADVASNDRDRRGA